METIEFSRKSVGVQKKCEAGVDSRGGSLMSYHSRKSYHPVFSQTVKIKDLIIIGKHAARHKNQHAVAK